MSTHNLPPLIAAVGNLALGGWVVWRNPRAAVNRAFGLLCLFLGIWNLGIFMMWYVSGEAAANQWSICLHLGLVFIPAAFLHLILMLTRQSSRAGWVICGLGYVLGGFFAVEAVRGEFTAGVQYLAWGWVPISGPTSRLFDYLFAFLVGTGIYYLLLAYRASGMPVERNRLTYVLVAVGIAALGSIPNFLMVRRVVTIYPVGHLVNVVSTAVLAYVIVTYRLLEAGLAVRRGLVLSGVSAFLVGGYVVLLLAMVRIVEGEQGRLPFLWVAVLALGVAVVLRLGMNRLHALVERRFFREHYEGQRILRELGSAVIGLLDLELLLNHAVKQIAAALRVVNAQVLLLDSNSGAYLVRAGLKGGGEKGLAGDDPLVSVMEEATSPLVRDEIGRMVEVVRAPLQERAQLAAARGRLGEMEVQVCVPLRGKGRLEGLLNVGDKEDGGLFSTEDIYLLSAVGNQLAVAVENARLYEELKGAYEQLTRTQQQLYQTEKLATLGELAAGVAHEINNPLGSIMLASQIMARHSNGNESGGKHLRIIEENVLRCKGIVSALLDFARQKEPLMVPTDIHQVLATTTALASSHEAVRGTTIVQEYGGDVPLVMADGGQLSQVFLNMIVNGAIASQPGGEIRISTGVKDGKVVIRFEDNGEGIPPEVIGKIFDPFFSTRKGGKGTGLGLSISYGIIQRHGGSISVESEEGKGSAFRVELPLEARAANNQTKGDLRELTSVRR